MSGRLSIVATPIGNLQDITLRALETLRSCDLVVCEDTRVTSKLLHAHGIQKPLRVLHEHTSPESMWRLIEEIVKGSHIAYASDAGTPGMNDPGGKFVAAALEEQIRVEPIPGPSALTAAISVCGFPMDDFAYVGFAPHKKGRATFFKELAAKPTPTVFLESTHRIHKTLDSLVECLEPNRLLFVGRELTKMHESVIRNTATEVRNFLAATSTKGEFILIVGPRPKS